MYGRGVGVGTKLAIWLGAVGIVALAAVGVLDLLVFEEPTRSDSPSELSDEYVVRRKSIPCCPGG